MKKLIFVLAMITTTAIAGFAESQTINIQGPNGNLVADVNTPEMKPGESKPMVVLMHGFGSNRHHPLVTAMYEQLSSDGIGVIRFDFDGCGDSDGEFVDMTVPKEIADAKAVYEYVKGLPWVSKIYFAGHSQGGVVASMTAGELGIEAVAGIALLAPAAVLREDAIRGTTQGATYDAANPPASVKLPRDMMLGRNYIITAQTLPIYDTSSKYPGPVLMLHGTGDIIVPYTYSLRYNEIYRNGSLRLLYGVDHNFTGHEKEASDVVSDFFVNSAKYYVL